MSLPIYEIKEKLLTHLRENNRLILSAPTGSGKTTQIPQFLLDSGFIEGEILVLQPRRIAARMVAARIAHERSTTLGEEVGFQTRHEGARGPNTRILFITEGLLLRRLQSSPHLDGVGAVIIDEFHERHLPSDIGLAAIASLQSQRPELRLLVMSATLETAALSTYLSTTPIEANGRSYPVEIQYQPPQRENMWDEAALCVKNSLKQKIAGDILIFMPGAYEIRRTIEACEAYNLPEKVELLPLYGQLPPAQQDRVMQPSPRRKIIVSTNVAETSLTIDGISLVIDSGLARINRFDPMRQLNSLQLEEISRANCEQRSGRAGRTSAGICIRLWDSYNHQRRAAHDDPEIKRLDLSEVFLQLMDYGCDDPQEFPWFEPPSAKAAQQAVAVLQQLNAVDTAGKLSDLGTKMARFPAHPRIARLLIEAAARGCGQRAAIWAAIASEQSIFLKNAPQPKGIELRSDFLRHEEAIDKALACNYHLGSCTQLGIRATTCRQINRTARLFCDIGSRFGLDMYCEGEDEELIKSLLAAYPDHVAYRSSSGSAQCLLPHGKSGSLSKESSIGSSQLLLVGALQEVSSARGTKTWLSLNSQLEPEWLMEIHPELVEMYDSFVWDAKLRAVKAASGLRFNGLLIEERLRDVTDRAQAAAILAQKIREGEIKLKKWNDEVESWIERVRCCAQWFPERELISYNEEDIALILEEICDGAVRYKEIADKNCLDYLRHALSWDDICFVEKMTPLQIELPSGRPLKIIYAADKPPKGRAKVQELYDLNETPTVAGGRVRLQMEILAPNYRPCQLTDDMASFWKNTYPQVKKDLRGRYPKHEWR